MKYLMATWGYKVYKIPADAIGKHRAQYYAELDSGKSAGDEYDKVYQNEFQIGMDDDIELADWAANNMNWEDVSDHVVSVKSVELDIYDEWCNAEMEILDE